MTTSNRKLGIIAGGGAIPKMLVKYCQKTGREFFVLAIEGNAEADLIDNGSIPHQWIRIGQAGTGFKRFVQEQVKDVVMIGTIRRPGFKDLIPDMRTTAFFARLGLKSIGDDGILRALVREIESEGMIVRGIHEVMSDLLVKEGILGKHKPDNQAREDMRRGLEVATELGRLDVGQAVVVQQGLVLGVEGIEGTDELIRRCGEYRRKGEGGVLVKLRKPQQDMRVDLPTIGTRTIERARESGLRGVVVHAGNGLIVDEAEVIRLADKYGIFVMGVNPGEELK